MFGLLRTAVRFFVIGFGAGLLLAPRAGADTREMLRQKLSDLSGSLMELAEMPSGSESAKSGEGSGSGRRTAKSRKAEETSAS